MHFLLKKIHALKIGWNERPLGEADFYKLCRRHQIVVEEMPLRVSGFYYSMMGRHFIAIDSELSADKKLFVMFHEFAHYLMHAPDRGATASFHGIGRLTRKEREADMFALIAILPRSLLEKHTAAELIDDGFDIDTVRERLAIFETRKI